MTFEEWYYQEHGCVPDPLDTNMDVAELATAFEAGQENQPDYYIRLKHEYVGRAMQGLLSQREESIYKSYVQDAIGYAKALIDEIKLEDEK